MTRLVGDKIENTTWLHRNMKFVSSVYQDIQKCSITLLIIYMKKFLHSDWLRAVQFLGNTVPKKRNSVPKKGNSVQISLDFKFLNFLTTDDIYSMHMFRLTLVCYNYTVNTLWN